MPVPNGIRARLVCTFRGIGVVLTLSQDAGQALCVT